MPQRTAACSIILCIYLASSVPPSALGKVILTMLVRGGAERRTSTRHPYGDDLWGNPLNDAIQGVSPRR
jgi:hypothetical protein